MVYLHTPVAVLQHWAGWFNPSLFLCFFNNINYLQRRKYTEDRKMKHYQLNNKLTFLFKVNKRIKYKEEQKNYRRII